MFWSSTWCAVEPGGFICSRRASSSTSTSFTCVKTCTQSTLERRAHLRPQRTCYHVQGCFARGARGRFRSDGVEGVLQARG
jgi:hypothetical protein